jgi:hypothetical protein
MTLEGLIGAALGAGIAIALIGYVFLLCVFVQDRRLVYQAKKERIIE